MPCKCSGVRYDKCKCRVLSSGCQLPYGANSSVMILEQKQSSYCIQRAKRPKRSLYIRVFESLYERCARYNLRYCPIRGFRSENCVSEALRDILLMLCFLVANFVVFLTIFARMTLHLSAALLLPGRWLRRSLLKKMVEQKQSLAISNTSAQHSHNFSPPYKIN